MKKIITLFLSILPYMAFSQTIFDCYRTESPITIDGRLDEKAWEKASTCSEFSDLRGLEFPSPKYKTTVKLAWDDDNLYLGAFLEEPDVRSLLRERDTVICLENDFELFLDPTGDGELYYELAVNAYGTTMDLLMSKPYYLGGTFIMQWDVKGMEVATSIDGKLNDNSEADKGWSLEMKIPFESLSRGFTNPRTLKVWRANIARVEWFGKECQNWTWAPLGINNSHRPERFGYFRFIDKDGIIPEIKQQNQ